MDRDAPAGFKRTNDPSGPSGHSGFSLALPSLQGGAATGCVAAAAARHAHHVVRERGRRGAGGRKPPHYCGDETSASLRVVRVPMVVVGRR